MIGSSTVLAVDVPTDMLRNALAGERPAWRVDVPGSLFEVPTRRQQYASPGRSSDAAGRGTDDSVDVPRFW